MFDLMNAISLIINVPFERVCHTQISTWWKKIIEDRIKSNDCRPPTMDCKKRKYVGGHVIEPKVGFYNKVPVNVWMQILYPSIMITHNISFDTVNCNCCKDDPRAKVGNAIMSLINSGLPNKRKEKVIGYVRVKIMRELYQDFSGVLETNDLDNSNCRMNRCNWL